MSMRTPRLLPLVVLGALIGADADASSSRKKPQASKVALRVDASATFSAKDAGTDAQAIRSVALEEQRGKAAGKRETAEEVTWTKCQQGYCQCSTRRRQVIRYEKDRAHGSAGTAEEDLAKAREDLIDKKKELEDLGKTHSEIHADSEVLVLKAEVERLAKYTNWWVMSHPWHRNHPTSFSEFSRGFKDLQIQNGTVKLDQCGGIEKYAKDCADDSEPVNCHFDNSSTNPSDAKSGQYCCSAEFGYCSYTCVDQEKFPCPSESKTINFPGGMDPAGSEVYKFCYTAQFSHGLTPESAVDGQEDELSETSSTTAAPAQHHSVLGDAANAAAHAVGNVINHIPGFR